MNSAELKDICISAIETATASRGQHKGRLKSKCPPMGSDGAAAWQAIMGHANPYKLGMGHIVFFTERQQAIYKAIDGALTNRNVKHLDRDMDALAILGVE